MSDTNKGLVFKTLEQMNACETDEHVCAHCEEDGKFYTFHKGKWINIQENLKELAPSPIQLYELNKQFVSQLPPLTEEDLKDRKDMVDNWVQDDIPFYLLYGREISYFTLFQRVKDEEITESVSDILFDCLKQIGEIISMDTIVDLDEPTIEIWMRLPDDFITVMYLFDYTKGVEKFHG